MKINWKILGRLLVLCIFILACYLLYHKLKAYSLKEIVDNFLLIPKIQLIWAVILVIINYAILVGYDWLAIIAIHKKLPFSKIVFVSFTGCAVSYNFGALLGGTAIRYRLYSSWGFHPLDIVRLVLMLAVTFWIGALGLAGFALLSQDFHLPPELGLNPGYIRPIGACLLILCLAYLTLCKLANGRSVILFKKHFDLPTFKIALAQTAVACADLLVAAYCLYVLLPESSNLSFFEFLPDYLLAQVAAVLTHVPGGMGVLEVILINLTNGDSKLIFASILMFRVLYYLIPLLIAAILLIVNETLIQKKKLGTFAKK